MIAALVQARLGSSRLPGKVLSDVAGAPMLARVMARSAAIAGVDVAVVVTSTSPTDDDLVRWCEDAGWPVQRGSEDDVLDRYVSAARALAADTVVRVTADCPLVCPVQAARVVERHRMTGADATHNITVLGSGMPLGTGVEAFTVDVLETSWREGVEPHHREHVDEYVYEHPERFAIERVDAPPELDRPGLRLTVDTAEDLELVRAVYARTGGDSMVDLRNAIAVLDADPSLVALNRDVVQKRR